MTTSEPKDRPDPSVLADADDDLGWDREKNGRFADYQTADDAVQTVLWGEED